MKKLLASLAFSVLLAFEILAASDPFVGTWTLNLRKSKYPPGTAPKGMVIQMEPVADGIQYHSETTGANGQISQSDYIASYDGKEATVKGKVGLLLPVSLKRIDPYTVEASYVRGLKVVATSRRVVSKDGRVMTITTISKDKDGKSVTNVGVYERTSAEDPREKVK